MSRKLFLFRVYQETEKLHGFGVYSMALGLYMYCVYVHEKIDNPSSSI